ncbi:hypothetical protein BV97_02085 [Novosphingobium resinovorum]|uniref:Uncharacterized protein n=1 Tax=Novosphingobium resinovorum TaxID=158500 RepID=A0A031K0B8_9SPHN|nr:hypothetical protein BV97_02085 [Novosphingobium resinovorum]
MVEGGSSRRGFDKLSLSGVESRLYIPLRLSLSKPPPHQEKGAIGYASKCSSAIFVFHTGGASVWTFLPSESTATVTGMSCTVNS